MAERNGPKCGGKRHGKTETCTLPAGWGTDHVGAGRCRKHLGNTPNVAKAAATEAAREEARRQLARLNVPPVSDPVLALRKLGGQAQWWNETAAENLNRLRAEELRFPSSVRIEQIRGEVQVYMESMRLCHQILTSLAKIDLDTWARAINERNAHLLAATFAAALAGASLAPELEQQVRKDFARGLRAISTTEDEEDRALSGVLIPPARPLA